MQSSNSDVRLVGYNMARGGCLLMLAAFVLVWLDPIPLRVLSVLTAGAGMLITGAVLYVVGRPPAA